MKAIRLAINGMGRVGRQVMRAARTRAETPGWSGATRGQRAIEIVAINDLAPADRVAYGLDFDTVHGRSANRSRIEDGVLLWGPFRVQSSRERVPADLPWGDLNLDVVLDCTGVFGKRERLQPHGALAPTVIVGQPADLDAMVVVGVNDAAVTASTRLLSAASCTTNAVAPVLAVLDRTFGVRWGLLGTTHAYTAGQALVDAIAEDGDLRRGRAAAQNIVPTTTGAGRAIAKVLPALAGKIDGGATRVPIADGSMFDATVTLDRPTDLAGALDALREAAATPELRGILDVRDDALVSSDIVGDPCSSIVDVGACLASGPLLRIAGWYDNEAAYAARLLDLATLAVAARTSA